MTSGIAQVLSELQVVVEAVLERIAEDELFEMVAVGGRARPDSGYTERVRSGWAGTTPGPARIAGSPCCRPSDTATGW